MIKTESSKQCLMVSITIVLLACSAAIQAGEPLATRFTYQGILNLSGSPVDDSADFVFALWDADVDGAMIGTSLAFDDVTVVDGLFAVELDFGADAFNGDARWLQIDVRSPAGSGAFATMTPRQPLTATPYALQTRGLFVNDLNKVGIGTTNPQRILHTFGDGIMIESDDIEPGVMLKNTLSGIRTSTFGLSVEGYTYVTDGNNSPVLYLADQSAGIGGVATNDFSVYGDVDVSGSFGIGTNAPTDKLHVSASGADANIRLSKDDNTYTSHVKFRGSGTWYDFGTPTDDRLRVWNDNSGEVLTILPNGNVGIGTDNPSAKLDVDGDINATEFSGDGSAVTNVVAEKIESATGLVRIGRSVEWYTRYTLLEQENASVDNFTSATDVWQSFTAGASGSLAAIEVLRGLAGDGTPGSAATVRLYQGEGTAGALLGTSTLPPKSSTGWQSASFSSPIPITTGQSYTLRLDGLVQLRWGYENSEVYAGGRSSLDPNWDQGFRTYILDTSGDLTPRLVADSAGNVGIGTTSPTATLDVNGTLSATNLAGDGSQLTNVVGSWDENETGIYYNGGNVVIGSDQPTDAALGIAGTMRINDNDILFRPGVDPNHGLGWYGLSKPFGSDTPDGPVLYGHKIGMLGTIFGGQRAVLTWTQFGKVGIDTTDPAETLDVRGEIQLGDDDSDYAPAMDTKTVIVSGRITQTGNIDTTVTTSSFISSAQRDSEGDYTVFFVEGTFSKNPVITVVAGQSDDGDNYRVANVQNESATQFSVKIKNQPGSDTNAPFFFTAVGER